MPGQKSIYETFLVLTDCSKIRARLSVSAFCELDVQSFTVARWKVFLPYSENKEKMTVKYKIEFLK